MFQIKILDSEIENYRWREMRNWMKYNIKTKIIYESDGDHDGYWIFYFERNDDKVEFILRWL